LVGHGALAKQFAEKIAVVFGNGVFAGGVNFTGTVLRFWLGQW
jgi:hypothetical protein